MIIAVKDDVKFREDREVCIRISIKGMGMLLNLRASALIAAMSAGAALSGCAGMSAPYGSEENSASDWTLVPVTADVVVQMALESQKAPSAELSEPAPISQYRYLIKPGDVLLISVPTLVSFNSASGGILGESGQGYQVYNDGTIYLPYAGSVTIAGLSLKEAQEAVVKALSGYLKQPQVVVTIRDFRSQRVMITGQIASPGYMPITDVPLTLVGALSTAGGITERRGGNDPRIVGSQTSGSQQVALEYPDLKHVALKRGGNSYLVNVYDIVASGNTQSDPILMDGDVVVVPSIRRANVFVLGEVTRPGLLEMDKDSTDLAKALTVTGGINQLTANPSRVYVIRGDAQKPLVYQVDASQPDAMLLAQRFNLLPNDIVYVAEAGTTRWNRGLQRMMPTIQGLLTTAVVTRTIDNLR